VHGRHFEGVAHIEIGKQAWDTLSEHGLADSRRPVEEHVMSSGRSDLAGPLGLHLTDYVCQVETTLGVLVGSIAYHIDRIHLRHRPALQKGDQLSDRGNTEHVDPSDEFCLSGLAQRHDHPGETCLLGRKSGGQDASDRPQPTVQPQLTQQGRSA
jgi:hypothetical protein